MGGGGGRMPGGSKGGCCKWWGAPWYRGGACGRDAGGPLACRGPLPAAPANRISTGIILLFPGSLICDNENEICFEHSTGR